MTAEDFALLADWIDQRLDPATAAGVEAMDAGSGSQADAAAWFRAFKAAAQVLPLEEPPPIVGQRLRQAFDHWRTGRQGSLPLPELWADSIFDSRRDLALAGMRSVQPIDQAVHVAFRSSRADLVVDVHRLGPGRNRLDGQLLPIEPGAAPVVEVTARGAGVEFRAMDGDELGRFCLPDVPDGSYELRASNGEFVVVAEVQIEPAGSDGSEPC